MSKVYLAKASDVPAAGMRCFEGPEGRKILIVNVEGGFHAFQGLCPHQDVCLDEGFLAGTTLTCHQHLWQWDARTGHPEGAAEVPLERYDLTLEDGQLYLVDASALHVCQLFRDVNIETLRALDEIARRESFAGAATLYNVGDPADDFYILESGHVEFHSGRSGAGDFAGFVLKRGEAFGWAALLDGNTRRLAQASCLESSILLRINGERCLELLKADSLSGFNVMRQLSQLITRHLTSSGAR